MAQRPHETKAAGVYQPPLSRRQRRDGGQVIRLERMPEPQQQGDSANREHSGRHGAPI
jgi:hypothetical protein